MDSPLASSNDYVLAKGKGIVLECASEKAGIIIPSPISDKEKK